MKISKGLIQTLIIFILTFNVSYASSLQGIKIMLDPGHGGNDSGAVVTGPDGRRVTEKEINNSLTKKLADMLRDNGAEIVFTRDPDSDITISLAERVNLANSNNVDLFISIHHNAATSPSASGTEVFYSTNRSGISSTRYVEYEGNNYQYVKETVENGIAYVYILVDGQERKVEKKDAKIINSTVPVQAIESQKIAQMVVNNIASLGFRNRGAKDSNLYVVRHTNMPSILIETGFMTNPDELLKLIDENMQINVAQQITKAIVDYYDEYNKNKMKVLGGLNTASITKRLQGANRYHTNLSIVDEGWTKADNVILAYGENFADALSVTPLSSKLNAPIILTDGKNLTQDIKARLSKLGAKTVYIIGGETVISKNIENEIRNLGYNVNRIHGQNRYETSVEIANELNSPKEAFVVTGRNFPDALSVASIASIKQIPILLVDENNYSKALQYIDKKQIEKVYIVGGTGAISEKLASRFPNRERISGNNRYQTNINVLNKFRNHLEFERVYVATGENYPDALSGAALSAKTNSPILLSGPGATSLLNSINKDIGNIKIIAIGGTKALSDSEVLKLFK
ncbi:cell wall-binding repeat-containing protein [Alkalithermobacter thermoalcaliphilus]|uniref:cell wall-binding repeat-containing protein n=1 Tax=Clostridium paradoxum TaxID=29346 RepID=UPI0008261E12